MRCHEHQCIGSRLWWLTLLLTAIAVIATAEAKIGFYGRNRSKNQRVLLVSFHGFRFDFIDRFNMINFKLFVTRDRASRAAFLNPQFATQSVPNLWSLVTGAYIESHGIVADSFYDPALRKQFDYQPIDNDDEDDNRKNEYTG
jgi:predicted AlkP superfamily pyrophosphatase or phosphodiesterase